MRYKSYVATYAGNPEKLNRENYYLNGVFGDNFDADITVAENSEFGRRNLYGLVSGIKSGDLGAELAYMIAGLMHEYFGEDFDAEHGSFFEFANSAINSRIFEAPDDMVDMDVSAVYIRDNRVKVFNMGDVPVFLIQKDGMRKLTGDIPEKIEIPKVYFDENGEIATEVIVKKTVPRLGVFDENCETVPHVSEFIKLDKKSYFVICSKALSDLLGEDKISEIILDKNVSDKNKATFMIDVATKENPQGNFMVEVIVATPGLAIGHKDSVNLARWVGVALICGTLWLTGPAIAEGISNLVDITKNFIGNYIPEKELEQKGPRWVPWQKDEPEKEEENTESDKMSGANNTEQQVPTPKPSGSGTTSKPQMPQSTDNNQQIQEESSATPPAPIPVEKESSVELPIDFN